MNPQAPIGPQQPVVEFTEEALDAKFSFSFTRRQLVVLMNALNPLQFQLGDLRGKILTEVLEVINSTAFKSLTSSDYKQPTSPTPPAPEIQTN